MDCCIDWMTRSPETDLNTVPWVLCNCCRLGYRNGYNSASNATEHLHVTISALEGDWWSCILLILCRIVICVTFVLLILLKKMKSICSYIHKVWTSSNLQWTRTWPLPAQTDGLVQSSPYRQNQTWSLVLGSAISAKNLTEPDFDIPTSSLE